MKTIGAPKQAAAMNTSSKKKLTRPSKKIRRGVEAPQIKFSDDESLPVVAVSRQISNPILPNVILRVIPEQDAVPASDSKPNFGVVIELRAPPLSHPVARAPIDLVMVLDVSSSMFGPKLDLVKRAAGFVVDNLGPSDRLSLVSFSSSAQRVLPLHRMTAAGRAKAKRAVNFLSACGSTNIVDGLTMGLRVLEERRHRNPVASIMFLSDGQNTCRPNTCHPNMIPIVGQQPYLYLLPPSIHLEMEKKPPNIPIHTFGFGYDHNPLVMHAIASQSGGTFSFIESYEMVQDAFASCIGGLLSVVVRDLRLTLRSASSGVRINSIHSGSYQSEVSGLCGSITVGDLYADEEKDFLIDISVPVCWEDDRRTPLLDVTCSYKDVASNERVEMESAEIRRPVLLLPCDVKVKIEVDRQKNRLQAAEGLAEAQRAAEKGNFKGARAILSSARSCVSGSAAGQAGDRLALQLAAEMRETEEKMGCKRTYEQAGRAYALSSMSAHANQRASIRRRTSGDAYVTPNMANMVSKCHQIIKIEGVKKEKK
ncbi:Zinc finger (C3HC4-type RING finger) family protein [Striga hermonthica]|uniref:Zinc finger (C3HC4-type RING finger) family protein n=1 Tax=Striga hermonthica TaxID=68872 RepID=A0A9N7NI10_STRHE|nr:Zinc finger (C3HC4-type RING finger) family protein [Striga hermonthica]